LKRLNDESGLTVVSVSHDLNLAAMNSNRIALLLCGSLVAIDQPEIVLTEGRIREAFSTNVLVDRHPALNAPRVTLLG
jgi:iron complex transport system ATP-binding protein